MTHLLALDLGTTSIRAIAFDINGKSVASQQVEITQHYPQSGWVEHDGQEITQHTHDCLKAVAAKIGGENIKAVGITNQRETTLIWNKKTGQPIARAIVWQDKRTASYCQKLKDAGHEGLIKSKTGLTLDPYFSASKIRYLLDEHDLQSRAESGELAFGTVDTWALYTLTGGKVHATDISNASRTLLFNIHSRTWDDDLLELFNIPKAMLPEVKPNVAEFGYVDKSICGHELPITGMAGDQQAATFGQACFDTGMMKSTYGTGCFALLNTGDTPVPSENGLLTTIAWEIDGQVTYGLEGSIFIAGAAVQWLRDRLKIIESAKDTEAMAAGETSNKGVYFVPAFAGLGAPYWDADARAGLVGMSLDCTHKTVVRATLESMAYQTHDLLEAMSADMRSAGLKASPKALRVDGGMAANNWLMQFMANVLNVPIDRPENTETTALGAAFLAGLGAGVYQDCQDIANLWQKQSTYTPHLDAASRAKLLTGWAQAVKRVRS